MKFWALCFLFWPIVAEAQVLDLLPVADNSIFSESSTESNGVGTNLFAGRIKNSQGGHLRRALIRFDISTLPADAIIDSVKLELAVFRSAQFTTQAHRFYLHRLLESWGEGTSSGNGSGALAQINDATWLYRFYPNAMWSTLGGTFVSSESASTLAAYADFPISFAKWSSNEMVSDVEYWRSNPNHGWIILGEETVEKSAKGFASKEMGNPYLSTRPKLKIYYHLPSLVIHEVNPIKKWVELYNAKDTVEDLTNYSLSYNGFSIGISSVIVKRGSVLLPPKERALIAIPNFSGHEILLKKGAEAMDYIQWAVGSQSNATTAANAGIWENAAAFLPNIEDSTFAYSLDTSAVFSSGKVTKSTNWKIKPETPFRVNVPCSPLSSLSNTWNAVLYLPSSATFSEELPADISYLSLICENSLSLLPGFESSNQVFTAAVGSCPE